MSYNSRVDHYNGSSRLTFHLPALALRPRSIKYSLSGRPNPTLAETCSDRKRLKKLFIYIYIFILFVYVLELLSSLD